MTEEDRETYLYQMRYAHYLFEKYGEGALRDLEGYEKGRMETIWQKIGEEKGRSVEALVGALWGGMGADFEFKVDRIGDGEIEISCTKCPFVELAVGNGMREVGYSKFCMSDFGIVRGFNPDIVFTRTKTLMEGHDCCNHHYKEGGKPA